MEENIGEITTLSLATPKSPSLRTTVPRSIILQFNLKAGDKIGWKLEARNNEMIIVVRPLSKGKKGSRGSISNATN